jgi:hypothetical protein
MVKSAISDQHSGRYIIYFLFIKKIRSEQKIVSEIVSSKKTVKCVITKILWMKEKMNIETNSEQICV